MYCLGAAAVAEVPRIRSQVRLPSCEAEASRQEEAKKEVGRRRCVWGLVVRTHHHFF